MSTWIYIECDHCHSEQFSANITWNLSPMWQAAGIWEPLKEATGKRAREIVDQLIAGIAIMRAEPDRFRALAPSNGWGSYEGAIAFLDEYIRALQAHPESTVRVS